MQKVRKRSFTLLEVMIAFLLVVLSILPLLYPHVAMVKEQRGFIQKLALDHFVNLHFAELTEQLYRNQIPWEELMSKEANPLAQEEMQRLLGGASLPYAGSYRFEAKPHKPKQQAPFMVYLMQLHYTFTRNDETLNYDYQIPIVKRSGEMEEEENETEE